MTEKKDLSLTPAPVNEPSRKVFFKASLEKPDLIPTTVTDMLERSKQLFNKQIQHLEREPSALEGEQLKALISITDALVKLSKEEREALKDDNLSNMSTAELERLVAKANT